MTRSTPEVPANPIRSRCRAALAQHRRRARADGCQLDYGLAELEQLACSMPTCAYCGAALPTTSLTFDHATPISRGGRHQLAALVVSCVPCNLAKGLLTAEEFKQLRALIRQWHPRACADLLHRLRSGGARYSRSRRGPAS